MARTDYDRYRDSYRAELDRAVSFSGTTPLLTVWEKPPLKFPFSLPEEIVIAFS